MSDEPLRLDTTRLNSSRLARSLATPHVKPCWHVVFELDARPRTYITAANEAEEQQLRCWMRADRRASAVLDALGVAA
jgi:hypothetical protein